MNFLDKLIDSIPPFRLCCLIVSIITFITLINYQLDNIYYSYIIDGENPAPGFTVFLLLLLYIYISAELVLALLGQKVGEWTFLLLTLIQPVIMMFIYCDLFNKYKTNIKNEMLKNSSVRIGYVFRMRQPIGRGTYHKETWVGIDKEYQSEHHISDKKNKYINLQKNDIILLRVSDEYPRVTEVLKWKPTHEEIERYKTPRKFKSYINGKIYEEDE